MGNYILLLTFSLVYKKKLDFRRNPYYNVVYNIHCNNKEEAMKRMQTMFLTAFCSALLCASLAGCKQPVQGGGYNTS